MGLLRLAHVAVFSLVVVMAKMDCSLDEAMKSLWKMVTTGFALEEMEIYIGDCCCY